MNKALLDSVAAQAKEYVDYAQLLYEHVLQLLKHLYYPVEEEDQV